ncbi:helix-turn-helix transcriptional regulator [Streptococcus sp. UMB0029]|jgi:XRE family transcriptional regulator|uniref:helix-turn-helix domain-containing protein n=1 Tax=Streptococcus sp. UMB0029 TaxID=2069308 RepID=UPI002155DB54|nr:helix-turn-helix transcriptional regulator [Streptococcus sp. UMB0029]
MATIKNRLKALRTEKGITQDKLATIINEKLKENEKPISKMVISNWENNKHTIKPEKAQILADFFGVSVSSLLGYGDEVMTFNSGAEFEEYRNNLIKRLNTKERLEKKLGKSTEQYKLDKKTIEQIELIKQRINQKYGTNSHGNTAYDALVAGIGENDFFIRLFDAILDFDELKETEISDLLYKYLILDNDSKHLILELINKLPQSKTKSLSEKDND